MCKIAYFCIALSDDGGVVLSGFIDGDSNSNSNSNVQGYQQVVKLDTSGNLVWQKDYVNPNNKAVVSYSYWLRSNINKTLDGGYIN